MTNKASAWCCLLACLMFGGISIAVQAQTGNGLTNGELGDSGRTAEPAPLAPPSGGPDIPRNGPDPHEPMVVFAPGAAALSNGVNQIERWRAELAPGVFHPAHEMTYAFNLDPGKQAKACGGSWKAIRTPDDTPASLFRIHFPASVNSRIRSYEGYGYACTFTFPDPRLHFGQSSFATIRTEPVHGLIRYADGGYWLGQVIGTRAHAVTRGGDTVAGVLMFLPAPHGIGEWGLPDGTRLQGQAELKPDASAGMFADLQSGRTPQGLLPVMTQLARAALPDGGVVIGQMRLDGTRLSVTGSTVWWEGIGHFKGDIVAGISASGTLTFLADETQITGRMSVDDDGVARWKGNATVKTAFDSPIGPPGVYSVILPEGRDGWTFLEPLRPEWLKEGYPQDAATLAKATRNDRGCLAPPVVPQGWIVWWPTCKPGPDGNVVIYRPDAKQYLWQGFRNGSPDGMGLNMIDGSANIEAKQFTRDAVPAPIGEARLRQGSHVVFEGVFDGQHPLAGYCAVPKDEGGGLEPCEFRGEQRVDQAHALRRQRIALKREQEDLLRQQRELQQQALAAQREIDAQQQQWEEEQARLAREAEDDEPGVDAGMLIAQGISDAFQHAADVKVREARQQVESSQRHRANMDAAEERQRARTRQILAAEQARQQLSAQQQAQQAELQRRQTELQRLADQQRQPASASSSPVAGTQASSSSSGTPSGSAGVPSRTYGSIRNTCNDLGFKLTALGGGVSRRALECLGNPQSYPSFGAFREAERQCNAAANNDPEYQSVKQEYEARDCHRSQGGGAGQQ